MTAPAHTVGASATGATNAALSVSVPAGTVDGDLLLMSIGVGRAANGSAAAVIGTPAGWVLLASQHVAPTLSAIGGRFSVFGRIANSEPANYSVTFSGNTAATDGATGKMVRVTGHAGLHLKGSNQSTASSTTIAVTGLTTTVDECLVLFFGHAGTAAVVTASHGTGAESFDFGNDPGTASSQTMATLTKDPAGASGSDTITFSATSVAKMGVCIAVAPVQTVPTVIEMGVNKTGNPSTDITNTFATDGPVLISAGDLLVAEVAALGGSTTPALATPAGWTKEIESVQTTGTVRNVMAVYYKVANGTETSVTFTATPDTATNGMVAKVCRIVGHDETDPVDVSAATAPGGNVTTYTIDGVTTTRDDDLVLFAVAGGGVRTFTPSGSLTELWDFSVNPGVGESEALAWMRKAVAGATGNQAYDPNTNTSIVGVAVAIQPSAPITVSLDQAVETDTAQPLTPQHGRALAQASETDAAQALTPRHMAAIAQATETDAAQALAPRKAVALTAAQESDSAQAFASRHAAALGQAGESDTAGIFESRGPIGAFVQRNPLGGSAQRDGDTQRLSTAAPVTVALGQATETDNAQAFTPRHARALAQATETDAAQALTPSHRAALAQAVETDAAQALAGRHGVGLGRAVEADAATVLTIRRGVALAQAAETDAASALTARHAREIGRADESDTANALTLATGVGLTQAVETDTAQSLSIHRTVPLARADETDAAGAFTNAHGVALGQATETDTAGVATGAYRVALVQAVEVDVSGVLTQRSAIAPAVEVDVASSLSAAQAVVLLGALESDAAGTLMPKHIASFSPALETNTALPLAIAHRRVIGRANEFDAVAAYIPHHVRRLNAAEEADTALALAPVKVAALSRASETDAARALETILGRAVEIDIAFAFTRRRSAAVSPLRVLIRGAATSVTGTAGASAVQMGPGRSGVELNGSRTSVRRR